MGTIYRVKNPETGEYQELVSKDYVDIEIKRIKDALNINLPPALSKDEVVDLAIADSSEVKASDIQQDASHRMVSESQLELFRRKPNMHEVEDRVAKAKKSLESKIDENYYKLLNMPNAVERLQRLSMILQNDDVLKNLFEILDTTVTEQEMEEHRNSNRHLSSIDRKSLILLQTIIDKGFVEKLEALTKDGAHVAYADTAHNVEYIGNYPSEDVFKMKSPDTIVVGHSDYCTEKECHVFVKHSKDFLDADWLKVNKHIGRVRFSNGSFRFNTFTYALEGNESGIVEGCGKYNTVISFNDMVTNSISYSDLTLSSSKDEPSSAKLLTTYSTFRNVIFKNCVIDPETMVLFDKCIFVNCEFKFSRLSTHIIITHNHFIDCNIPTFMSKTVIIKDNFQ